MLIIGFALHNATEGFGIVGPLGDVRPSWRWLGLAGLIGGGPTFLGAMVGYQRHLGRRSSSPSTPLAGGAILYVIGEIWHGMRRYGHRELGLCAARRRLRRRASSPTSSSPTAAASREA